MIRTEQLRLLEPVEAHDVLDVAVIVTCSCGELIESHAESAVFDEWERHVARCRGTEVTT